MVFSRGQRVRHKADGWFATVDMAADERGPRDTVLLIMDNGAQGYWWHADEFEPMLESCKAFELGAMQRGIKLGYGGINANAWFETVPPASKPRVAEIVTEVGSAFLNLKVHEQTLFNFISQLWSRINDETTGRVRTPPEQCQASKTKTMEEVRTDPLREPLDSLLRFTAGLQLQDQPVAIQRERRELVYAAVRALKATER